MYREIRCSNCHTSIAASQLELLTQIGNCPQCNESFSIKDETTFKIRLKNEVRQPDDFELLIIPNYEFSLIFDYKILPGVPKFIQNIVKLGIATKFIQGCITSIVLPIFLCLFFNFSPRLSIIFIYLIVVSIIARKVIKSNLNNGKISLKIKDNILSIKNPNLNLQKRKNFNQFNTSLESTINTKLLDQVFVTAINEVNGYMLNFLLKDGTLLNPIFPLFIIEEALFIEQEIELFLRITDSFHQKEIRI